MRCSALMCEVETVPFWKGQTLAGAVIDQLGAMGFVPVARDCQKSFQYNLICLRPALLERPSVRDALDRYASQARATLQPFA